MSGIMYFIPDGHQGMGHEQFVEIGLGHAFDAPGGRISEPTRVPITGGPGGHNGILAACDRRVSLIRYKADKQTWQQIPQALLPTDQAVWLGWYTDDPPTPQDLARPAQRDGHSVRLGDDREWMVPLARAWVDLGKDSGWMTALPQTLGVDDSGDWVANTVVPQYRDLWDLACRYWDSVLGAPRDDDDPKCIVFPFSELNNAAVLALQTNYYIGKAEIAALGLFVTHSARDVMLALIDYDAVDEYLKKKERELQAEAQATD